MRICKWTSADTPKMWAKHAIDINPSVNIYTYIYVYICVHYVWVSLDFAAALESCNKMQLLLWFRLECRECCVNILWTILFCIFRSPQRGNDMGLMMPQCWDGLSSMMWVGTLRACWGVFPLVTRLTCNCCGILWGICALISGRSSWKPKRICGPLGLKRLRPWVALNPNRESVYVSHT